MTMRPWMTSLSNLEIIDSIDIFAEAERYARGDAEDAVEPHAVYREALAAHPIFHGDIQTELVGLAASCSRRRWRQAPARATQSSRSRRSRRRARHRPSRSPRHQRRPLRERTDACHHRHAFDGSAPRGTVSNKSALAKGMLRRTENVATREELPIQDRS